MIFKKHYELHNSVGLNLELLIKKTPKNRCFYTLMVKKYY